MVAIVDHLGHDVPRGVVGVLWVVSYVGICRKVYQTIVDAFPTR